MKRLFFVFVVSLTICVCVYGQKKEIVQAQTIIKSGKNLDKAETEMRKLLLDSANIDNIKIWLTLTDAIRLQYEQGNEQLYLKQNYDTATLFLTCQRMFHAFEAMDSVDMMPDRKGNIKIKYRKKNADYLNPLRRNLYNGGAFFVAKQKYDKAFSLFESYLDCVLQPLFSNQKYSMQSDAALSAAYLATYCGVKLGDTAKVMKYSDLSLKYKPGRENTLQFLANIYEGKNDKESYKETLKTGFREYPTSEYFFSRLVDCYNNANQPDSSMLVVERAIAADSTNLLFYYGKSSIMLNTGKYMECVAVCDSIIAKNNGFADAYYNAGVAYVNLAFDAEKNGSKKSKVLVKKYYAAALPYMERYRELAPEQKDKWAAALYNIYLNLNMGKKFEEITKILQN